MILNAGTLLPTPGPRSLLGVMPAPASGWEQGLDLLLAGCLSPELHDVCGADPTATDFTHGESQQAAFEAFVLRQPVICSTFGNPDLQQIGEAGLRATADASIGAALWNGTTAGNPGLMDAPVISATTSVAEALGCLEAWAAANLFGRRGYLHVPARVAALLPDHVGPTTRGGLTVIVNPGYDGASMAVSGDLHVGMSPQVNVSALESETNTLRLIAVAWGIAVFAPCQTAQAPTGLEACPA